MTPEPEAPAGGRQDADPKPDPSMLDWKPKGFWADGMPGQTKPPPPPLPAGQPPGHKGRRRHPSVDRSIGLGTSSVLHALLGLLLMALPMVPAKASPRPKSTTPIPIEVVFATIPVPAVKVAPNPVNTIPVAAPPAPAAPPMAVPNPQAAAQAPRRLLPREAVRPVAPAPRPMRLPVTQPRAGDLAAAAAEDRRARTKALEEAALAKLAAEARQGQATPTTAPASRTGNPNVAPGAPSGELTARAILHRENPQYPPEMQAKGDPRVEVVLTVYVDADGAVTQVLPARPSGYQAFDRAAADAIGRWKFAPLVGGSGAVQHGDITIYFTL